jgi:hypothetical protein
LTNLQFSTHNKEKIVRRLSQITKRSSFFIFSVIKLSFYLSLVAISLLFIVFIYASQEKINIGFTLDFLNIVTNAKERNLDIQANRIFLERQSGSSELIVVAHDISSNYKDNYTDYTAAIRKAVFRIDIAKLLYGKKYFYSIEVNGIRIDGVSTDINPQKDSSASLGQVYEKIITGILLFFRQERRSQDDLKKLNIAYLNADYVNLRDIAVNYTYQGKNLLRLKSESIMSQKYAGVAYLSLEGTAWTDVIEKPFVFSANLTQSDKDSTVNFWSQIKDLTLTKEGAKSSFGRFPFTQKIEHLHGNLSIDTQGRISSIGKTTDLTTFIRLQDFEMKLDDRSAPYTIPASDIEASYSLLLNKITIRRITGSIFGDNNFLNAEAEILRMPNSGQFYGFEGKIAASNFGLNISDPLNSQKITFAHFYSDFHIDLLNQKFRLSNVQAADLGEGELEGSLYIDYSSGNSEPDVVNIDARAQNMQAQDMVHLIPSGMEAVHEWLETNILQGVITKIDTVYNYLHKQEELDMKYTFKDATIKYVPHMEPVSSVSGSGYFTATDGGMSFDTGQLLLRNGKAVKLESAKVDFFDINTESHGRIVMNVGADAKILAVAVNELSKNDPDTIKLNPSGVSGYANGNIFFTFPISPSSKREEQFSTSFSWKNGEWILGKNKRRTITFDELSLRMKDHKISVLGNILIDETVKGSLKAKYNLQQVNGKKLRFDVAFDASRDAIFALGFPVSPIVEGIGKAYLQMWEDPEKKGFSFQLTSDLTQTILHEAHLNWYKPVGFPASLTAFGHLDEDTTTVTGFEFKSEKTYFSGSLTIKTDEETNLNMFFDTIQLGDSTRLKAYIKQNSNPDPKEAHYEISVSGKELNIQDLLKKNETQRPGVVLSRKEKAKANFSTEPTLRINKEQAVKMTFNIDKIHLNTDIVFNNLKGQLQTSTSDNLKGHLKFQTNNSSDRKDISLEIQSGREEDFIDIYSDNAGDLLAALGITKSSYDGKAFLAINVSDKKHDAIIKMKVKHLNIEEAPKILHILSVLSLVDNFNIFGDKGSISFSEIFFDATINGDKVNLQKVIAEAASFGITGTGSLNLKEKTLNIYGVFSPFYLFNGMINGIPYFGELLSGGRGQGLFGINYRLAGDWTKPKLSSKPATLLFPGFFRNIISNNEKNTPEDTTKDKEE